MRDTPGPGPNEDLLCQAVLYARGELEPLAAEAFEKRLGCDQAARDALCAAVELAQAAGGRAPAAPGAAYRAAVRRRLRPPAWRRLVGRHSYRGHPLLWTGLGAAAALLLAVAVGGAFRHPAEPAPDRPAAEVTPAPRVAEAEPDRPPAADVADVWAELHDHRHLAKAHEEEMRRKNRPEGRSIKAEERRIRPLGHPMAKHP
jgi:hypothetical protein